jgi:transposase
MEEVTTVAIDLAKNVFSLHGVDAAGKPVLRRTVRRDRLVETLASLSPCQIGMGACSGAHEWGRRFERFGHTVKLMAPKFVAPYRKSGKNDGGRPCSPCTGCATGSWWKERRSSTGCEGCFVSLAWCCRCARSR